MKQFLVLANFILSSLVPALVDAAPEAQQQDSAKSEKSREATVDSKSTRSNRDRSEDSDRKDKPFVPRERISADAPISFPADI